MLQASLEAKNNEIEVANQFQKKRSSPSLIVNRLLGKRDRDHSHLTATLILKYAQKLVDLLRQAGKVTSVTSITKVLDFS